MRNYVIINGVNSLTIQGLAINNLPPITKPMIRTQREEIDGRDGDIVTELGYSAYDKQIEIGLWGNYDINDIIKYFTGEGTIVFSNEDDKYYNFKILDQIDYEKLLKFKTATITLHCQPFKYPLEEEPVEAEVTTLTGTGETITLNNTEEAPMKINLKGNTSQATTTGKNFYSTSMLPVTEYGITISKNANGDIVLNGTPNYNEGYKTFYTGDVITVEAGTYTLSVANKIAGIGCVVGGFNGGCNLTLNDTVTNKSAYADTPQNVNPAINIRYDVGTLNNFIINPQMEKSSSATTYEPFTNGASPNPDYPQDVNVVSGDNTIDICGKNLLPNNATTQTINNVTFKVNDDKSVTLNGTASAIADFYMFGGSTDTGKYLYIPKGTYSISSPSVGWFYIGREKTLGAVVGNSALLNAISSQDCYFYGFIIRATSGSSFSNLTLYPQIEKNSSASTYEPYQGNTYNIDLPVENLFDKDTIYEANKLIQTDGAITSTQNFDLYKAIVQPNTSYTLSITNASGTNRDCRIVAFTSNGTYIQEVKTFSVNANARSTGTFTTPANTSYILYHILKTNSDVQLEKGSKANTFTPYGTTPIELCKIGDYQDRIYKDSGKWYIEKQIGKVVLNGSTNRFTQIFSTNTSGINRYRTNEIPVKLQASGQIANVYCDKLIPRTIVNTYSRIQGISVSDAITMFIIYIDDIGTYTLEQANNWLSTNNLEIYYVLATPTYTEITDSTLLSQLNALEGARSYDNQTNISQANNDLSFELDVSVTFVVPMEINNIGNIYAKPILTIEGTGNVGVVLNDIQILEIDLTNNEKIAIDVTKLEAYNPDDDTLLNRLVTGDYMKLLINEGENTITFTGSVSSATLTNYIRWI